MAKRPTSDEPTTDAIAPTDPAPAAGAPEAPAPVAPEAPKEASSDGKKTPAQWRAELAPAREVRSTSKSGKPRTRNAPHADDYKHAAAIAIARWAENELVTRDEYEKALERVGKITMRTSHPTPKA